MSETRQQPRQELTIFQKLESSGFKQELARALPNTLKPERMVRLALTMIKKNSAIAKCDPLSIMACVVETAQLGLEPEGVLGHAYLVPFGGVCTLIIGYRGFAHLMYQSGVYADIGAEVVRPADEFRYVLGTKRELVHVPAEIAEGKEKYDIWRGAYAYSVLLSGSTAWAYLQKSEILLARARSKSWQKFKSEGKASPWDTDAAEMWKKTAIRRLAKRSQTSTIDQRPNLLRAVMLDEYSERKGLLVPTLSGFEVNPNPPEPDVDEEPLTPSAEAPDEVIPEERVAPKPTPAKSSKRGKKQEEAAPANKNADVLPRAKMPTSDRTIDVQPVKNSPAVKTGAPKSPFAEEDPFISSAEQTDLYNLASNNGWKIPDEVKHMLTKKFQIDTVRLVRRSLLPKIRQILETGT